MNEKWKELALIATAILALFVLVAGAWENAIASDDWEQTIGHALPAFLAVLLVATQVHRLVKGKALIAWSSLLLAIWALLTVHIALSTYFELPPDGYRLLGLQPELILGSLLIMGIVAGLVSLYSLQVRSRWFLAAIIALCLYGVAGIMLQLVGRSGLFAAPDIAPALPVWLSGASLTAFLTLPLLLIAGLYLRLARKRVAALGNAFLALMLTAVVIGAAAFPFSRLGDANWTVLAGTSDPSEAQDRISGAVAEILESYQPEPLTVDRVLTETGRDADSIFMWVRNNTHYVPYRGALRGTQGVLSDRLGNSLDRALLLSALLRKAGHQVRFSRGVIETAQVRALLADSFETLRHQAPETSASVAPSSEVHSILERHQIDVASIEDSVAAETERAEQIQSEMARRTDDVSDYILEALKSRSSLSKNSAAESPDGTDHWWVSIRENGRWVSMDPSDRNAGMGDRLTAEHQTVDTIPDAEYHTVQLELVVEVLSPGGLEESVLISKTFSAVGLGSQPIELRHFPVDWPGTETIAGAEDPVEATRSALLDNSEWMPVMSVGNANAFSKWFSTNGMIFDTADFNPNTTRLGKVLGMATERTVGGATDLFGSLPGGLETGKSADDEPEKGSHDTFVSAEWLVFSIHAPGRIPIVVRRQVFDLIGPAARSAGTYDRSFTEEQELHRALALMASSEILVSNSAPDTEFIGEQMKSQYRASLSLLNGKNVKESPAVVGFTRPLSALRFSTGASRQSVYLAAPNVLSFHIVPTLENGAMGLLQAYDIVFNEVEPLNGATDAFRARIRQGVLDTVAEILLLPYCQGIESTDCERIVNASDDFFGTDWTLLMSPDEIDEVKFSGKDEAEQRVRDALESGYLVLAPEDARTPDVWWELDPDSGQILGYGPNGWGVAMSETIMLNSIAIGTGVVCVLSTINSSKSAKSTVDGAFTSMEGAFCTVGSILGIGSATGYAVVENSKLKALSHAGSLLNILVGISNQTRGLVD